MPSGTRLLSPAIRCPGCKSCLLFEMSVGFFQFLVLLLLLLLLLLLVPVCCVLGVHSEHHLQPDHHKTK
jgi:hypothetical protein